MRAASVVDPREVDAELRQKYDVRGPRYTSYPPAPHFHELDPAELGQRWSSRNGLSPDPGLSLYVHIPFCETRCLFCGCNVLLGRSDQQVEGYLDSLGQEMALATSLIDAERPVREIHWGGGTPNYLNETQVHRLRQCLDAHFCIDEDASWSVEVEPRSATATKLDAFLKEGFSRFSLGVQDFHPDVLQTVCRRQDTVEVEEVVQNILEHLALKIISFLLKFMICF